MDVWKELEKELDDSASNNIPSPASKRTIAEIDESDEKIQTVGKVEDMEGGNLRIRDKTGSMRVIFDDREMIENLEPGDSVRIYGSPLTLGDSIKLHARIIQNLDELNLKLFEKVRNEVKKFERELMIKN